MNKAIRLIGVMILLAALMSSYALALGIGTNNKAVAYEPNVPKSASIYVINDEHKDTYVEISVSGSLAEYATAPKTLFIPASEEIKKFDLNFELPEGLEDGDLKVVVSETTVKQGQIGAKVYAIANIKIAFPSKEAKINAIKLLIGEQDIDVGTAAPSGPEEEVVVNYPTSNILVILLTTVIAVTVLIDLAFYYRKRKTEHARQHLRDYIVDELEKGKGKEEIKSALATHGWKPEALDRVFDELKNEIGKL